MYVCVCVCVYSRRIGTHLQTKLRRHYSYYQWHCRRFKGCLCLPLQNTPERDEDPPFSDCDCDDARNQVENLQMLVGQRIFFFSKLPILFQQFRTNRVKRSVRFSILLKLNPFRRVYLFSSSIDSYKERLVFVRGLFSLAAAFLTQLC